MLSKLYLNTEMVDKSLDALHKGERFAYAIRYGDKTKPVTIDVSEQSMSVTNFSEKEVASALNSRLTDSRVDSKTSGLGLQIAADLASKINVRLYFRQEASNRLQATLSWISPAA
jgi:hypothetical protein